MAYLEKFYQEVNHSLRATNSDLLVQNEWLSSQMPERIASDKLERENAEKEELLKKRGKILNVLDLSQIKDKKERKEQMYKPKPSPPLDPQIN